MKSLEKVLIEKNKTEATNLAKILESLSDQYLKKSFFEKFVESTLTLVIAIFIAILVRQIWFENYTF